MKISKARGLKIYLAKQSSLRKSYEQAAPQGERLKIDFFSSLLILRLLQNNRQSKSFEQAQEMRFLDRSITLIFKQS
jgi:hypothetical protein